MTDTAFEAAVERHGDAIFRLAYSYLKNRADAEDVMQETLLKLYRTGETFADPDHQRYWVIRVAANECKKLLRSPWRRRTAPLLDTYPADGPEERETLEAVQALPAADRAVVHLYYYEGYKTAEIAAMTGLREGTVRSRLSRARSRLRELLKGEWE